jgi:hypothetical protein
LLWRVGPGNLDLWLVLNGWLALGGRTGSGKQEGGN